MQPTNPRNSGDLKNHHPLLLTLGEPAGIGPDCTILLWQQQPELFENLVVVAPPDWLRARANILGIPLILHLLTSMDQPLECGAINCLTPPSVVCDTTIMAGSPAAESAAAVIAAIRWATKSCLRGEGAALVTGPIEKAVLRDEGFAFPGHTEFLAHLCGDVAVVMMLASPRLRVALLTTHLALRAVPDALSIAGTITVGRIVDQDMRRRFGLTKPRLGLCALNPHGGEAGHFGDEEVRILQPARTQLRAQGVDISDPLPADTCFSPPIRSQFDAIICCYHDQALIPLKMDGFGESINISLGLPIIRTSVDHGTALDRAGGRGGAVDCRSLGCAITTARAMAG
ncbi:MAG: 4-hydroxythreonine-4-phosphate dehydrogenase PdxA [Mariprofundales bacterium]|nr:4-hydroxythreonine-4-phosphate dehydrogenase PdxA [Mariprofundales bacterium]